MTHWEIARFTLIGLFLGLCAIAGYIAGGLIG